MLALHCVQPCPHFMCSGGFPGNRNPPWLCPCNAIVMAELWYYMYQQRFTYTTITKANNISLSLSSTLPGSSMSTTIPSCCSSSPSSRPISTSCQYLILYHVHVHLNSLLPGKISYPQSLNKSEGLLHKHFY